LFGGILTISSQIVIQPLSQSALDHLADLYDYDSAEDPDAHDYGSEAQEPQTEDDEDEQGNSQIPQILRLRRYDECINDVAERLRAAWEVTTLASPFVPHLRA
jgi:Ran GTPase-activating protein (RanGAP) involved in mRNA processing and transport